MKASIWFVPTIAFVLGAANLFCQSDTSGTEQRKFSVLKASDGREVRALVAGPANAESGILLVHDYFGISDATEQTAQRLAGMGYRVVAIDLYGGKSATVHEQAVQLMQAVDQDAAAAALQTGLNELKRPGRRIAAIAFSMGGLYTLRATLNDAETVTALVIVYGFGFDAIETKQLEKLNGSVLVISGSEDRGAMDTAFHFLSKMKEAKRNCELFVYPAVDHGYAQPLFNEGKNYSPEAVRATWVVVDDFLRANLAR